MKRLILLLIVIFSITAAKSQFVYKIKADSVLITNDSCTAELIIENSTKHIKGFLVNRGNGRTEFRQAVQLTDSSFVIAGDTIVIRGTGLAASLWQINGSNNLVPKPFSGSRVELNKPLYIIDSIDGIKALIKLPSTQTQANPIIKITDANDTSLLEMRAQYRTYEGGKPSVSMFIGPNAGMNNSITVIEHEGAYNTGIGDRALMSNTTGSRNTAVGLFALKSNTTGSFNTAIGQRSMDTLVSGGNNTGLGYHALSWVRTSNSSTALGSNALEFLNPSMGSSSTADVVVGAFAGRQDSFGDTITKSNNVFIGWSAGRGSGNKMSGNVLIGYEAGRNIAVGNNKLYMANKSTTIPLIYGEFDNSILSLSDTLGRFGIRTKTPGQALHVVGQVKVDTLTTGSDTDSILVVNNGVIKKILKTEGPIILAKGTVTNVATLDIDMSNYYTLYDVIEIKFYSARPATNGSLLLSRFSADASTYASSGYKWNCNAVVASSVIGVDDGNASNTTSIQIAGACSNTTERTVSGTITLNNPGVSTFFPMLHFVSSRYNNTPDVATNQGTGLLTTAQVTKAVRLYFSSGNISTMSYKVIGYKN